VKVEERMNEVLSLLGVRGWRAVWSPDPDSPRRGGCLPGPRIILVHDERPEDALETLVHEAVEIRLRGLLNPYRELVNVLIEYIERLIYREKERFIESLTPLMLRAAGEEA